MKTLWAPWRMEFILDAKAKKESVKSSSKSTSIFFELSQQKPSQKNLILYKGQRAFVILNKYPYANGHLMVIPLRQVADFSKLNGAEHKELGELLSLSIECLKTALQPDGFNIGMNLGTDAGAGIIEHLHYHVVPRWRGDTNFMPVFAEARVLPEHMQATYKKLKKIFEQAARSS